MLKTRLLHPDILNALGRIGHGSRILIADGNFSFQTRTPPHAVKVFLNLAPGIVGATQVLEIVAATIPVESALAMAAPDDVNQPLLNEFAQFMPGITIQKKKRDEFYGEIMSAQTALVIATGEQRRFANLLLTVGVVKSPLHEPS
jgi:L-fucose mutarotase